MVALSVVEESHKPVQRMSSNYLLRDAILSPLHNLQRGALTYPVVFETDTAKLEKVVFPCELPKAREEPLKNYKPTDVMRLKELGSDGYAAASSPLVRLFAPIPPLLSRRPFTFEAVFSDWEEAPDGSSMLPIEIGELMVSVGGAEFRASKPTVLARDVTRYIAEHSGIDIDEAALRSWFFDAPEVEEHAQPYQGLLADSGSNATKRLASLSLAIRNFLGGGGEIKTGDENSEVAAKLSMGAFAKKAKRVVLRV